MFNPNSTIYQTEWLDLVFANRNKSYGAYELRQNYNKRLAQALLITSMLVVLLFSYPFMKQYIVKDDASSVPAIPKERIVVVDLPPVQEKKEALKSDPVLSKPQSEKIKTHRFVKPEVVSSGPVEEPPTNHQLQNSAIGTQRTDGLLTTSNLNPIEDGGVNGTGKGLAEAGNGDAPVNVALLEKYPEFPGGMEGFAKFLRKNLRYPSYAADAGISGKVFVSFIVEMDGRLTDIKILKGIGFGCDEEAARVLKKSPLWSPGIQNKNVVRVLYTIPLHFQMSE